MENGLWSYTLEEIWKGLQTAYAEMSNDVEAAYGEKLTRIGHIGFSAMMHGYLAFDKDGELLVPFRTWQNTNTHEAHEKLSELFQYNIPERWSIAHLYQCVLNNEEHVSKVAFFTTLAGYVHWKLTGRKVLGVGDASGMFPIDPEPTRGRPRSSTGSTRCPKSPRSRGSSRTCCPSRWSPARRPANSPRKAPDCSTRPARFSRVSRWLRRRATPAPA